LVAAGRTTSDEVEEIVGNTVTGLTLLAESPPNYVDVAVELLANKINYDSVVNTDVTMDAITVANSQRIVIKPEDEFRINAQAGGALSSGDIYNIESVTITASYEQEHVREIKGEAGNGEPRATGSPPLAFELTVQFRGLADLSWFEAHQDGDEYKMQLVITGPIAGGAVPYLFRYDIPRAKIVVPPSHPIGNAGDNPLTVTFKGFVASTNPTGMASRYPMVVVVNTKSTEY
jgi:hypothetical protein